MTAPRPVLDLSRFGTIRRTWLVTGAAGFIGSHLVESLLLADQAVVGLDNFATGSRAKLDEVAAVVGPGRWNNFRLLEGDINELETCREACAKVDLVLHQAALGSVPRSVKDPISTNATNVVGFLNMLVASHGEGVKRFVYAASSSTYGDSETLPKVEEVIGQPLSPYAVTKLVNELYASVFARTYGIEVIGLRYFNVFGPRQDPDGPYAAVIPKWVGAMLRDEPCVINGDGETTRDFCYVKNVVQANLLAATVTDTRALNQVYNVAVGGRTSLKETFESIRENLAECRPDLRHRLRRISPEYANFRPGDVRHSQADISKAMTLLGYRPTHDFRTGIRSAIPWYVQYFENNTDLKSR